MIVIKCFGNIEIEGTGTIPADIKLISAGNVQIMNSGVLFEEIGSIQFLAPIKEEGNKE